MIIQIVLDYAVLEQYEAHYSRPRTQLSTSHSLTTRSLSRCPRTTAVLEQLLVSQPTGPRAQSTFLFIGVKIVIEMMFEAHSSRPRTQLSKNVPH